MNELSVASYMAQYKARCCECPSRISTGYKKLDILLSGGLTNELYVLGAETSTGKSAISLTIAHNIAMQPDTEVLYFALEMSVDEIIARGVSAISYECQCKDEINNQAVTVPDQLYMSYDNHIGDFTRMPYGKFAKYIDIYEKRYCNNMYIIEGGAKGITAQEIYKCAEKHKRSGKKVVVFVDYLQLIKSDSTSTDRKNKVDDAVMKLKGLALEQRIPVFLISSVGRSNYSGKVQTSSYKESGDTEYTGGVLIGWNWKGVTDTAKQEDCENEKKLCKNRGYRFMTFNILKKRNGERDTEVTFKYYPAYNYFSV